MGLFSSKKTTTENVVQNSNATKTTTPIVPEWILSPTQNLAGQIGGLTGSNPLQYVAGSNPLLDRAADVAGGLNSMPWNFDTAADYTRQVGNTQAPTVQAASLLDNLSSYMSPYTKDVVDTALADYDVGAGMTRAQDQLARAADTTFGGSGGAIQTMLSNDAINRGRATTSANLRDQAFTRGSALASEDAARRQAASLANAQLAADQTARKLQAGAQLADLSTAFGANERANVATQFDLGQFLRGMDQEKATAPLTLLDYQTSQLSRLPLGLFAGETTDATEDSVTNSKGTTKSSGSLLSKLGQAAQIAATVASMSDRRLKQNIRRIGTRDDGIATYEFEYVFAPGEKHVGVMAQEVQAVRPDAVMTTATGFLAVDYGRLS